MARIMIVDDTDEARRLLEKRLIGAGYEVSGFGGAQAALEAIAKAPPDLVLMDVNMPGMDGMEATRRIVELQPNLPVIFLSALGHDEAKLQGLEAGGRDYIVKGSSAAEILIRVKKALQEKQAREAAERRAENFERLAITDPLTELANRRYFELRYDEEVQRATRYGLNLSCLMIDIDKFKSINDTYGHTTGDEVIIAVAQAIRISTRSVDLPARFGGEEFVVLLPETELERALTIAERIRASVEAIALGEGRPRVTTSVGVSSGVGPELLENADKALYEAKRRGRNRVEKWPLPVPQSL